MNEETHIYEIPSWNVPVLEGKIKKINKRANKIGCPELKITKHGETHRVHPRDQEAHELGIKHYENCAKVTYHKISIDGEPPKFAGWTFLGTLDHWTIEGSVLVKTVPGHEIPERYFEANPECDHCGKIRRRKDTFVLQSDNEEYKQVGRMCLKDFLGHDPRFVASYLQQIFMLTDDLDNEREYFGGFSREYISFELERSLALTCAVIRAFGWVSRSIAKENPDVGPSTASTVIDLLHPPVSPGKWYKKMVREVREAARPEKDIAEAKKAIEWVEAQEANNEYMHNLKAIVKTGYMNYKTAGYACSIIATYQRTMERLRLKEIEYAKRKNEWVGTEKKRQEFTVEVIGVQVVEGYYGATAIHRMLDDEGRSLVWFASGSKNNDLDAGKKYRVMATVKSHDTYKDWKQTKVNRVKVVEELS